MTYLTPKIKSATVKQWLDKSEGIKTRVIPNFQIGEKKEIATTTLVIVPEEESSRVCYSTNIDVTEVSAYYLHAFYSKRWGIETAYRTMKNELKPRTTSKKLNLRLLYYMFMQLLLNALTLTNLCASIINNWNIDRKNLLTAKEFMERLIRTEIGIG